MSLRIVRRRWPGRCETGKGWYGSELEAKAALHFMRTNRGEQRAYKCNLCPGWHLTSQPLKPKEET